jgi:hypothetical protein
MYGFYKNTAYIIFLKIEVAFFKSISSDVPDTVEEE